MPQSFILSAEVKMRGQRLNPNNHSKTVFDMVLESCKNGQQGSGEATPLAKINHPAPKVTALPGATILKEG